jgi:hypothetical protein
MTKTVSPADTRAFSTALMQVFTGSMNEASSKLTSSGTATIPRWATQGKARTYCANPPPLGSKPAVSPTFL